MNKRAAELPMNFIVIAAIAVIVLILIIMLLLGGLRTDAISSQTAANSCAAKCFTKQRVAIDETRLVGMTTMDAGYCTKQDISGIGKDKTCADISPCTLQFSDVTCKVSCPAAGITCT